MTELREGSKILEDQLRLMDEKVRAEKKCSCKYIQDIK